MNKGNVCHNCQGELEGNYEKLYKDSIERLGENHRMRVYCCKEECRKVASKDVYDLRDEKKLEDVSDDKKTNLQIERT